jgi:hypothetical protein
MNWIQTISGKRFDLIAPCADQIDINDIAYSLGMLCRFNGHGLRYYSVAEHAVHVSREISPEHALAGLLHDASEAYIGDVPAPLKRHLPDFQRCEVRLETLIAEHFGLKASDFTSPELKRADMQLLVDEKTAIMLPEPAPWPPMAPPPKDPDRILCLPPEDATQAFLRRFAELAPHHKTTPGEKVEKCSMQ